MELMVLSQHRVLAVQLILKEKTKTDKQSNGVKVAFILFITTNPTLFDLNSDQMSRRRQHVHLNICFQL